MRERKEVNRTKQLLFPATLLCLTSLSSEASPWIEASDPFLRSSVLALSDASLLDGPTNQYPLRWSLIGDIATNHNLTVESSYVKYMQQSAKLNRGSRRVSVYGGSDPLTAASFGDVVNDKWGIEASYAYLDNSYSFRLNSIYSNDGQESELSWRDSYLSFNAGSLLIDVGYLPRWWGQGWQHNLVLQTEGEDIDLNASLMGENNLLGVWNLFFLTSKLEQGDFEYRSSARFINRIARKFEYGISYHHWFEGKGHLDNSESQLAIDVRLSLPEISKVYHSVYFEWADANFEQQSAYLIGWTGHISFDSYSVRLALEHQDSFNESSDSLGSLPSSYSASIYAQFPNDHKLKLAAVRSELSANDDKTQVNIAYSLPALQGQLHLETELVSQQDDKNDALFWAKYEFRF